MLHEKEKELEVYETMSHEELNSAKVEDRTIYKSCFDTKQQTNVQDFSFNEPHLDGDKLFKLNGRNSELSKTILTEIRKSQPGLKTEDNLRLELEAQKLKVEALEKELEDIKTQNADFIIRDNQNKTELESNKNQIKEMKEKIQSLMTDLSVTEEQLGFKEEMIQLLKKQNKSFLNEVNKSIIDTSAISEQKPLDASGFIGQSFFRDAPDTENLAKI